MATLLLIRGHELSDSEHRLLDPHWQVLDRAVPVVARLDMRASMRSIIQQAVKVGRLLPDVEVVYHEQPPIRVGQARPASLSVRAESVSRPEPTRPKERVEASTMTPTSDPWWVLVQRGAFDSAEALLQHSELGLSDQAAARRLLDAEDERVLVLAISLIGSQGWSNFVHPLRLKLRHSSPEVRQSVLRALQQLSVKSVLPYVELLLDDPDHRVASLAARVVRSLSR